MHAVVSGLCLLPQALGEPFAYETYRQQRIEAKLDAQREGRISLVRKLPKVTMQSSVVHCLPGDLQYWQLPRPTRTHHSDWVVMI